MGITYGFWRWRDGPSLSFPLSSFVLLRPSSVLAGVVFDYRCLVVLEVSELEFNFDTSSFSLHITLVAHRHHHLLAAKTGFIVLVDKAIRCKENKKMTKVSVELTISKNENSHNRRLRCRLSVFEANSCHSSASSRLPSIICSSLCALTACCTRRAVFEALCNAPCRVDSIGQLHRSRQQSRCAPMWECGLPPVVNRKELKQER